MRPLRAVPHPFTQETPNFMSLGRETRLSDNLMYSPNLRIHLPQKNMKY